jgi:transcriptional regulator with XRE-family HTH domain
MISAYEANKNDITFTKLKMLADALDVHVLELTGEYDKPTAPAVKPPVVQPVPDKSTENQLLQEMIALYKKQILLLEKHTESLSTNVQSLEKEVMDLTAKLTHYESRAKGAVRSA